MIIDNNDASIRYTKLVKSFCRELFNKTPINFFIYARFYPNGSVINLTTHPEWHKYYRKKNYHLKIEKRLVEGIHSWKSSPHTSEYSKEAQSLFGIYNKLEIVEHHGDYIETFGYGGGGKNGDLDDFYLNNICLLKTYNKLFLAKAHKVIEHIEKNSEYLEVSLQSFPENVNNEITLDMPSIGSDKDLAFSCTSNGINIQLSLTPQQFNVLALKIRGYSDQFIAECLKCSVHNVKYHYKKILSKIKPIKEETIYTICEKIGIMQVSKGYTSLFSK